MIQQDKNSSINKSIIFHQQTSILPNKNQDDSVSSLKDSIISLQFRIKTLESQINTKMERQQCFTLLDRKSNLSYVKKAIQQIYSKIQTDRLKEESVLQRFQEEQKQKIDQLKKKLKQQNYTRQATDWGSPLIKDNALFSQIAIKKIHKSIVKPQQLYLQSNQTMFSMIIDQIKELKHSDSQIERLIESKHKKTVSLNNQVCRKLENFQNQLEEIIKQIDNLRSNISYNSPKKTLYNLKETEQKKPTKKVKSKGQKKDEEISEKSEKKISQNDTFQNIRVELLSQSVQNMQKQVYQKLNIKDVVPIIKQMIPNFQQSMEQLKAYMEENFQSIRRILQNQSQINNQITKCNKVGWWHCYQKLSVQLNQQPSGSLGYILFTQEIINIIPESLVVQKNEEDTLKVLTKGWYLLHIYQLQNDENLDDQEDNKEEISTWIEINSNIKYPMINKKLLNLAADTQLKIITSKQDIFLKIQKI